MSVINGRTNMVTATVTVGSSPNGIAVSPEAGVVYVANDGSGTVSVISMRTNTVIDTFTVGSAPFGDAVSPVTGLVYVANAYSDTVSVIYI